MANDNQRTVRTARRGAARRRSLLVALALVIGAAGAGAAPGERRFGSEREADRGQGAQRQPQPDYRRQPGEQAPSHMQRGGQEQRPQRLSPEERHQLRRDIQDAGRAIYPQRR